MKDELTREEIKTLKGYVDRVGWNRVANALGIGRLALATAMHQMGISHGATLIAIRTNIESLKDLT